MQQYTRSVATVDTETALTFKIVLSTRLEKNSLIKVSIPLSQF